MNEKITQLKPKQRRAEYHVLRSSYAERIVTTHDIETARIIRDQLEDTYVKWFNEKFSSAPDAEMFYIRLT
tara:strand:+ start:393 stop:605 length:213 start_codon:yes stop_codon:yes gene_type:complete